MIQSMKSGTQILNHIAYDNQVSRKKLEVGKDTP